MAASSEVAAFRRAAIRTRWMTGPQASAVIYVWLFAPTVVHITRVHLLRRQNLCYNMIIGGNVFVIYWMTSEWPLNDLRMTSECSWQWKHLHACKEPFHSKPALCPPQAHTFKFKLPSETQNKSRFFCQGGGTKRSTHPINTEFYFRQKIEHKPLNENEFKLNLNLMDRQVTEKQDSTLNQSLVSFWFACFST